MRPITSAFIVSLALFGTVSSACAQFDLGPATAPTPTPAPATAPATARARHVATVPPGFKRVEFEGRTFFLPPDAEPWVTDAVAKMTPPEMPTTMPTDLRLGLQAQRENIKQRMSQDLGVEPAKVDEYLDQRLKLFLERLEELRPPIIYLVTSPQQLKDAMKAGWADPRFYYNRAADDVNFSTTVNLSLDEAGDDMVLPIVYDPSAPVEQRQERVTRELRGTEGMILGAVSQRTQAMVLVGMVEIISNEVLDPLDLKEDQEWFGVGVAGVIGGRYAAQIIGYEPGRLMEEMTRPDPRSPMRPESIDLLDPPTMSELRQGWQPVFADAFRRRSMQVVLKLVNEGGEGAIRKVIAAMKQNPPADGPALAQLIKQATGVDLMGELRAK